MVTLSVNGTSHRLDVELPPPAISNAVFDAMGIRLRSVPFTAAKLKTAMGSART